jgi:hypothetical protein
MDIIALKRLSYTCVCIGVRTYFQLLYVHMFTYKYKNIIKYSLIYKKALSFLKIIFKIPK